MQNRSHAITSRRALQPVTASWQWLHEPIWPNAAIPDGLPGMLLINGTPYLVTAHVDATANRVAGFRLTKSDGTCHDVDATWWSCDCPDATFRKRACKHVVALRSALKQLYAPDAEEWDDAERWETVPARAEMEYVSDYDPAA